MVVLRFTLQFHIADCKGRPDGVLELVLSALVLATANADTLLVPIVNDPAMPLTAFAGAFAVRVFLKPSPPPCSVIHADTRGVALTK